MIMRKGGELMAYFHICRLCGAHLDPGEHCDCNEPADLALLNSREERQLSEPTENTISAL